MKAEGGTGSKKSIVSNFLIVAVVSVPDLKRLVVILKHTYSVSTQTARLYLTRIDFK